MACNYWGCVEEEIELTVRDLCKDVQCEGGKVRKHCQFLVRKQQLHLSIFYSNCPILNSNGQICVADSELNKAVCLCPDNCAEENESVPDIGCSNYCTSYFSTCQVWSLRARYGL